MKTVRYPKMIYRMITLAILILAGLIVTKPALAFEDDSDGYIPADQTVNDDLIISEQAVIIDGIVNGDVIASGEKATINGTINGNLVLNVGTAEINGFVNGSVAVAGQQLAINSTVSGSVYFIGLELFLNPDAQINRNLLFGGFSLTALPGSIIGRDLLGTGYQVTLDGLVGNNVLLDVAAADVSGKIHGDANFEVSAPISDQPTVIWMQTWTSYVNLDMATEQLTPGLRIYPAAQIQGKLTYTSEFEQSQTILAEPGGGVEYIQDVSETPDKTGSQHWFLTRLRELLTLIVLGALTFWLLPQPILRSNKQLGSKPVKSFGWGLITFILGYLGLLAALMLIIVLGGLLAIVTLGGLAKAIFTIGISGLVMIAGIFTLLVFYGSKIIFTYWLGDLILSRTKASSTDLRPMAFFIGIVIYIVLRLIPILSPLIGIIAILLGLGGMALVLKSQKEVGLPAESDQAPTIRE